MIYDYDPDWQIGIKFKCGCGGTECCDTNKIIQSVNEHTTKTSYDLHKELRDVDIKNAINNINQQTIDSQNAVNNNIDTTRETILSDVKEKWQRLMDKITDSTNEIIQNDNSNHSNMIDLVEKVYDGITINDNTNRDTIITNIKQSQNEIMKNDEINKNSIITNNDINRDMVINNIVSVRDNINSNTNSLFENFKTWLRNNMTWHT